MNLQDKYFELYYTERITEYSKIDAYRKWPDGQARNTYNSLDKFYCEELGIENSALIELRDQFASYNELYKKYRQSNIERKELFGDYKGFMKWYINQRESCYYCEITQSDLFKIVEKRGGNLTLNKKTKRSKGTLEIEKLNSSEGYTFENSVLACPFCNNAKSNLISADHWRLFFKSAIQEYFKELLRD